MTKSDYTKINNILISHLQEVKRISREVRNMSTRKYPLLENNGNFKILLTGSGYSTLLPFINEMLDNNIQQLFTSFIWINQLPIRCYFSDRIIDALHFKGYLYNNLTQIEANPLIESIKKYAHSNEIFHNNSEVEIPLKELSAAGLRELFVNNCELITNNTWINFGVPSEFLRNGKEIVIASLTSPMDYVYFKECIEDADVIIFVMNASMGCRESEMETISKRFNNITLDKTVFAVDQMGLIPKKDIEELKTYVGKKLSPYNRHPIFYLSRRTDLISEDIRHETTDSEWVNIKNYINEQLHTQEDVEWLGGLIKETLSKINNFLYHEAPVSKLKLQGELTDISFKLIDYNDKFQSLREKFRYKEVMKLEAQEGIEKKIQQELSGWFKTVGHTVNKRLIESIPIELSITKKKY